ncbi:MAG: BrnT family toxin [Gammaproteobacteria bacterium]|nr:BrnT family toxin [Gammaproteobacteria bacterium]
MLDLDQRPVPRLRHHQRRVPHLTLEETRTAFYDENAIQFYDPDHSDEEDRFLLLGLSLKPQVLVVCHCFRERETIIRIISARRADRDEELEYWRQRR